MRRFLSFALSFSLVGYFVAQEPISVADAYPPYDESANGSGYQRVQMAGYVAGGYVVYRAVTGGALGGIRVKVPTLSESRVPSLYEVITGRDDEFRALAKILRNTAEQETYQRSEPYTVFLPTSAALAKALGGERVALLQGAAGQQGARHFIAGLTVAGSYNLQRLRALAAAGKTLTTLTGETIVLKLEGSALTANGVALLATEYPARNGFVLVTEGIVAREL